MRIKASERKLARFSEIDKNEQTYNLAAYLIAQLGKNFNDRVKGRITGQELLEAAIFHWQVGSYENGCLLLYDIEEAKTLNSDERIYVICIRA